MRTVRAVTFARLDRRTVYRASDGRHHHFRHRAEGGMGRQRAPTGRTGPPRALVDPGPAAEQPAPLRARLPLRARQRCRHGRRRLEHRGVLGCPQRRHRPGGRLDRRRERRGRDPHPPGPLRARRARPGGVGGMDRAPSRRRLAPGGALRGHRRPDQPDHRPPRRLGGARRPARGPGQRLDAAAQVGRHGQARPALGRRRAAGTCVASGRPGTHPVTSASTATSTACCSRGTTCSPASHRTSPFTPSST